MVQLVKDNLDAIAALCIKHKVLRLELFGSAACGDFDPMRSDVDFLVEFEPVPFGARADQYFGLMFDLEKLLGRRIDLAEVGVIKNRYVRASIEETKVPIYAAA
ncbi:MAG: nucleotidyltransferase domain-containing protein [Phycisphaerales bacterium]|nr:nucleotidyltransferase domain-containing protein [Phycisphaerales bacterium]